MLNSVRKPNDYDVRVFINCPFDQKFKPIFDAILFAIHDLGFRARHALIDDGQVIRIERIAMEIATSRYSLHDMSRVELGDNKLPRFNMPFEAGIAYTVHAMKPQRREHHMGVLDAKPYQYQASISDLAGLDPKAHENDPEKAVACVRDFLRRKSGIVNLPGAAHVWNRYLAFQSVFKLAAKKANLNILELNEWAYVNDLQYLMANWIKENPA
jgi:hypothetical protein